MLGNPRRENDFIFEIDLKIDLDTINDIAMASNTSFLYTTKGIDMSSKNLTYFTANEAHQADISSFEKVKSTNPSLALCVRHPVKVSVSDLFEETKDLAAQAPPEEEKREPFKSTVSGREIPLDEPIYVCKRAGGRFPLVYLTEAEVQMEGHPFDVDPLIYFRVSSGHHFKVDKLPTIDLAKYYQRSET